MLECECSDSHSGWLEVPLPDKLAGKQGGQTGMGGWVALGAKPTYLRPLHLPHWASLNHQNKALLT